MLQFIIIIKIYEVGLFHNFSRLSASTPILTENMFSTLLLEYCNAAILAMLRSDMLTTHLFRSIYITILSRMR